MKRKSIIAGMLTLTLVISMMTGCAAKETPVADVTFNTTKLANVIVNDSVKVSDLLYEITPEENQQVTAMTLSYGGEDVTLETEKDLKTDTTAFVLCKENDTQELFNTNNVPNAAITFGTVTQAAADLNVTVSVTDKDKKTAKASVSINVMVLPETVKPVKAITENLRLSESLKDYDFDVRAKNIADKASDTIESITVKKSNVVFGKAGHYEVSYEIKMKPNGTLAVGADAEVVDQTTENTSKENVVTANATPAETVEVTTNVDVVDKETEDSLPKDAVITDNAVTQAVSEDQNTENQNEDKNADAGNTPDNSDSSTPPKADNSTAEKPSGNSKASTPVGGSSSFDSNSAGSNNHSSNGNDTPAPVDPPHTHNWTAHTATQTVWVPNIVTVDDYETRAEHRYDSRCSNCGALFGSIDECSDHQFAGCFGGRQNIACTHTSQVYVGSHTEDQGYNTTESYTDYYYCSCGAIK